MTTYYVLKLNDNIIEVYPNTPQGQTDARNSMNTKLATDLADAQNKYTAERFTVSQVDINNDHKGIKITVTINSDNGIPVSNIREIQHCCYTVEQITN